jgi:hypothetical protein
VEKGQPRDRVYTRKLVYAKRGVLFWLNDTQRVSEIVVFAPRTEGPPDAKQHPNGKAGDSPPAEILAGLKRRVSLVAPYARDYAGAHPDRISALHAVAAMCHQARIPFNGAKSEKNTDPVWRDFVRPKIVKQPARQAIESILNPLGLKYQIENGEMVLHRR